MGFESFQTRLMESHRSAGELDTYLRSLPEISVDVDALHVGDARCYLWNDGRHVVEFELNDNPVRLSSRFMLCNPETISAAFGNLLCGLQARFGGRLEILDLVPANRPSEFGPEDQVAFQGALRDSIAARRAEWVAAFGPRIFPANSREVFREFFLPHCEPVSITTTTTH